MTNLKERIESAFNKVEEMAKELPGYKGYKAKEVRREADKLIRLKAARELEVERARLNAVEVELAGTGSLRLLMVLDRPLMRLQFLIDRLKTASYGYAGLFDAVKVGEAELEALYALDAGLLDTVGRVSELVSAVVATEDEEETVKLGNELLQIVEEMNSIFSKRQDAVLGIESV
jgi:hypothetical protein